MSEKVTVPKPETWYVWRELVEVKDFDGKPEMRLLTPWSNPKEYEHPFDLQFETPELAQEMKDDMAPGEDWVLCLETVTPLDLSTPRLCRLEI